ncbi:MULTISPECIES: type I phosphomannose isomerase catalytic subunit [unclassified Capnocytophaga]|uniref:type I phosphomannose isomerase catalytic subunit n=1 Tax=unclassified Capnocytophaga TaxID=2640652 RepID=UPI000202ED4E|nr:MULTISPECIES: type I phosphomannose isomerase catalytic subunit [unclassified Capnocytophaga]EGD33561.1 mannose-6-phosphate isomerase [Capnocytophaga sp. oral taxon 338 str. F0234]MEB3005813.1 type I phosphomannose isomerase catalytic subunit [Capnocytophaga sp. G2]
MNLYPLIFNPIFKERLWGGDKLREELHKSINQPLIGESWEISTVKGDVSIINNGALKGTSLQALIEEHPKATLGENVYKRFGTDFPLLIKFIDAAQDLSIQVHPNNELAKKRHNSFGKTEMWYIMEADPNSSIIIGFNRDVSKEEYQAHLEKKTLTQLLNYEKVKHGDMFFIPAGKIHAIGAGVLLAEIQQTSDITYRVYDFDRKDKNGNYRELHTELALDAIDFQRKDDFHKFYNKTENIENQAVNSPYFTTSYLKITQTTSFKLPQDSFHIYMGVGGKGSLQYKNIELPLEKGNTLLVPACCSEITLTGAVEVLQVHC